MVAPEGACSLAESEHWLSLSRQARWHFPTSSGHPVADTGAVWVQDLLAGQRVFSSAARTLLDADRPEDAVELAANVWRLWVVSREMAAGSAFLAEVLGHPEVRSSRFRAIALYGDGLFAFWSGALADSVARNDAALEDALTAADAEALTLASTGLSRAKVNSEPLHALEHACTALRHASKLAPEWSQAPLHLQASATRALGDLDQAVALFTQSLALNLALGDSGMVVVELHNLGHLEVRRGNAEEARRLFDECSQLGDPADPFSAAMETLNRAATAYASGDRPVAAVLFAEAESALLALQVDPATDDDFAWLRQRIAGA